MRTKKIKSRRMWGCGKGVFAYKSNADYVAKKYKSNVQRVAVLPADADSIERMVEQMVLAISETHYGSQDEAEVLARAALASIGIHSRAPKS